MKNGTFVYKLYTYIVVLYFTFTLVMCSLGSLQRTKKKPFKVTLQQHCFDFAFSIFSITFWQPFAIKSSLGLTWSHGRWHWASPWCRCQCWLSSGCCLGENSWDKTLWSIWKWEKSEKCGTFANNASWQNIGKRQIWKQFGSKLNFAAKFAEFGGGTSNAACG